MSERWPGPEFHVRASFRAPLPYVFAWCTDFGPEDARLEKDTYERRVIARSRHRVIFEDLYDGDDGGWRWSRHVVSLRRPNRWHSDSVGSHRTMTIDYVLTALSPERTRLDLRWKRRPTALGPRKVSRLAVERSTTRAWRNFARELEKDYRKSRPKRKGRRR